MTKRTTNKTMQLWAERSDARCTSTQNYAQGLRGPYVVPRIKPRKPCKCQNPACCTITPVPSIENLMFDLASTIKYRNTSTRHVQEPWPSYHHCQRERETSKISTINDGKIEDIYADNPFNWLGDTKN